MVRYSVSKYSSSFSPEGRGGRNENVHESLPMNIHSNIIPTNPKWKEPTGAQADNWIKEMSYYLYDGSIFAYRKE